MEQNDQREFPRKDIQIGAEVERGEEFLPAKVQNITVKGILLELGCPIGLDENISIRLSGDNNLRSTLLMGKVVRSEVSGDNKNSHLIGVNLCLPNDNYMMDVMAYIHGDGFSSKKEH